MGKILIVSDKCIFGSDSDLLKQLETEHTVSHASDVEEGDKITDEAFFDVTVIRVGEQIDEATREFVEKLQIKQTEFTSLILVSENLCLEAFFDFTRKAFVKYCQEPLDSETFMELIGKSMQFSKGLRIKMIILKKKRKNYRYHVRYITRVHRSRKGYINIYYWNSEKHMEEEREFYYEGSLDDFIERYDIGDQIIRTHQSWLANAFEIKSMKTTKIDLFYDSSISTPLGRSYKKKVRSFLEEMPNWY